MNQRQVREWREKARQQNDRIAQAFKADMAQERSLPEDIREHNEELLRNALAQLRSVPWVE